MVFVTTKSMLNKAMKEGYAVGAFNTSNLEFTQAIVKAADEMNSDLKSLKEDFNDVFYKMDLKFMRQYGLLLMKAKDIKRMNKITKDLSLIQLLKNIFLTYDRLYNVLLLYIYSC